MTRVLPSKHAMRKALALSFAAHGALLGTFVPFAHRFTAPPAALLAPEDRWTGTTAELPSAAGALGGPLVDVSLDGEPAPPPAPPKVDAPRPSPAPPKVDTPPAPAGPAVEKPRHRPRTDARRGETEPPASTAAPKKPRAGAWSAGRRSTRAAPHAAGGAATGSFGAAGPASVRDLGRALTRAIPPACDADPAWGALPAGDAGKLEVAIRIDGDGHIASAEPRGTVQPKALVNVLRRTIPLLQAGTFAVRGGERAEGTEILELGATVSEAEQADDAPAAPNQLAFEYARGKGKARFTQSSGRRVEITVRVVRIEAGR